MRKAIRIRDMAMARLRAARLGRRSGVTICAGVRVGPRVNISTVGTGRIFVGSGVEIAAMTTLLALDGAVIEIGAGAFIGGLCTIAALERIDVGEETMIAEMVCIRDHDHDPDAPPRSGAMLREPVHVGARTWLGSKASVVRGGSVGEDSVIGAHALVCRPIPSGVLAVGVPARVVRELTISRSRHSRSES